jgi:zinc D-Ala-D-Ala carboxypeptidase
VARFLSYAFSVESVEVGGRNIPAKSTQSGRLGRGAVSALVLAATLLTGCSPAENPEPPRTLGPSASPAQPVPSVSSASPSATPSASTPTASPSATTTATTPAAASSSTVPTAAPSTSEQAGHRDPASVQVLVNKRNPLQPDDWAPADLTAPDVRATRDGLTLRAEAAAAAADLFAAAAADGVDLALVSAYRSYSYQQGTYAGWVQKHGRAGADRVSARPGYSEHQTGLAMDVGAASGACTLERCFGDTPEGAWVARHAVEHGWIVRYPAGAEDATGYSPEPWHLRYVGSRAAADVVRSGGVLETAWGFAPAPDYGP